MAKTVNIKFKIIDKESNPEHKNFRGKDCVFVSLEDFPKSKFPFIKNIKATILVNGIKKDIKVAIVSKVEPGSAYVDQKLLDLIYKDVNLSSDSFDLSHAITLETTPFKADLSYKLIDFGKYGLEDYKNNLNCIFVSPQDFNRSWFDDVNSIFGVIIVDKVERKFKVVIADCIDKGEMKGTIVTAQYIHGTNYDTELNFVGRKHTIEVKDVNIDKTAKMRQLEVSISLGLSKYKQASFFYLDNNDIDKDNDKHSNIDLHSNNSLDLEDEKKLLFPLKQSELIEKIRIALDKKPIDNGTRFVIDVDNNIFSNISDKKLYLDCEIVDGRVNKKSRLITIDENTSIEPSLGHNRITAFFRIENDTKKKNIKPISNEIKYDWSEFGIGGLQSQIKSIIKELFIPKMLTEEERKLFNMKPVKGALFYGPPGTGKTLLFHAMANNIIKEINTSNDDTQEKMFVKVIKGPELKNKYVGESASNLRNVFKDAISDFEANGKNANTYFIFFDEADAIFSKRDKESRAGSSSDMVTQFLTLMDQVPNIFVVLATNRRDTLDPAVIRDARIGLHINFGMPEFESRVDILNVLTSDSKNIFSKDIDIHELARKTKGCSGAGLRSIVESAKRLALEEGFTDDKEKRSLIKGDNLTSIKINNKHIEKALLTSNYIKTPELIKFNNLLEEKFCWYNNELKEILRKVSNNVNGLKNNRLLNFGIFGKTGTGRTLLAVNIAKKLQEQHGFDIDLIQSQSYCLDLPNKISESISNRFSQSLEKEKSIIIIDDILFFLRLDGINHFLKKRLKDRNDVPKDKQLIFIVTCENKELFHKYLGFYPLNLNYDLTDISSTAELKDILTTLDFNITKSPFGSCVKGRSIDDWVRLASIYCDNKNNFKSKDLDLEDFLKRIDKDYASKPEENFTSKMII